MSELEGDLIFFQISFRLYFQGPLKQDRFS